MFSNPLLSFKVDLVKTKDKLLDITADLTCGMVNGRRIRVRPVIKPPWAKKRSEGDSELPLDEDMAGPEGSAEPDSVLNKEQLKALRSQEGWPHFKDVFMLSSIDREDVETLKVHSKLWLEKDKQKCTDKENTVQQSVLSYSNIF